MRAFVVCLALLPLATPAAAASWTAEMVEDEGGPVMTASVTGAGGDVPPELELMCAGDGTVGLRYGFGSGPGEEVEVPTGAYPFVFNFGKGTATVSLQYEEMDGMYAAYIPVADPVIGLLKSNPSVTLNDPIGVWHDQVFPLDGSSKAIDTLMASCE